MRVLVGKGKDLYGKFLGLRLGFFGVLREEI